MQISYENIDCDAHGHVPHPKPRWPEDDRYAEVKRKITLLMSREHHRRFKHGLPDGLTRGESCVLMLVDDYAGREGEGEASVRAPGVRPGELARALRFTPSALSQVLKSLEAKGLIERRRAEGDSRAVEVMLTGAGARAVEQIHALRNEQWNLLFDYLGDEDVAHLMRIAERICAFREEGEEPR